MKKTKAQLAQELEQLQSEVNSLYETMRREQIAAQNAAAEFSHVPSFFEICINTAHVYEICGAKIAASLLPLSNYENC